MLKPGDPAPDFTLQDHQNHAATLRDLLRAGPLLLYFYPADFTPICTREACMFRDRTPELIAAGVRVAGISSQSPESHARFRARHGLEFPLLADPEKRVIKAYGANGPLGIGVRRVSYFIVADPEPTVRDAVRADLSVGAHDRFLQRVLTAWRTARAGR